MRRISTHGIVAVSAVLASVIIVFTALFVYGVLFSLPKIANAAPVVVTFTASGSWTVPAGVTLVDALVVAGGGGGANFGGGGGGGGVIYQTSYTVTPGAVMPITVGAGGAGDIDVSGTGGNGQNSVFGTLTAIGGGGGGSRTGSPYNATNGAAGGSGGGGSAADTATTGIGGAGTAGQGFAGGNGLASTWSSGGGGGAGGAGAAGSGNNTSNIGGNGGPGISNSISGAAVTYAGGGGGSVWTTGVAGSGGAGGGGRGSTQAQGNGVAGTANTGGGGGAATYGLFVGGAGGSGIVILRYTPPVAPTCTITPASQGIASGSSATINYTITGLVTTATINGVSVATTPTGTYSPAPTTNTNYTMTVTGPGGSTNCGPVAVTILPAPTCTMTLTPTTVTQGVASSLSWTSANATSATIDNNIGSVAVPSGSQNVSPALSTTYTGTFVGGGGSVQCAATLTVNAPTFTGAPILGYAWSDTIGWIDLNCANSNTCATNPFGFKVSSDGTVTGYAWSENIGWISANDGSKGGINDLAGCPIAPCKATLTTTAFTGWLRALAGNTAQDGGWDGFISLSGTSPAYGVTNSSTGNFGGYAWGDANIGWVDFSRVSSVYNTCTPTTAYTCSGNTIVRTDTDASCQATVTNPTTCVPLQFCSPGSAVCLWPQPKDIVSGGLSGHLQAKPSLISKNATTNVTWNIGNVNSCTVVGTNNDGTGSNATGVWNTISGQKTTSVITQQTTYTLTCQTQDPTNPTYYETTQVNVAPAFIEK